MSNSHPHVYDGEAAVGGRDWRWYLPEGVRPYIEPAPLAAMFLGISSGLAFAMIGATLFNQDSPLKPMLHNRVLVYIAAISYALYIIHPFLMTTWLGSGEGVEKYIKRPLLFIVLFIAAHLSTYHYEKHWIALGKRLSQRRKQGGKLEFK